MMSQHVLNKTPPAGVNKARTLHVQECLTPWDSSIITSPNTTTHILLILEIGAMDLDGVG